MITSWSHLVAISMISVLTLASGIMAGQLDGRWDNSSRSHEPENQLRLVPEQIGPWTLVSRRELENSALQLLQCDSYLMREYWNSQTGDRIHVAVLFGPRGPIAVHKPEVCYSGTGTEVAGPREREVVNAQSETASMWRIKLKQPGEETASMDVWYAWSDGGPWKASDYPRFWLTDRLYKIQLASRSHDGKENAAMQSFLTYLLPALRPIISN